MTEETATEPVRLAILVRRFPNIVQTYVLNHILSMKAAGMKTIIVAANPGDQADVHPAIGQYHLLDETLYIRSSWRSVLLRLPLVPFGGLPYLRCIARLVFSATWIRYGLKYTARALVRARIFRDGRPDIVHSHSMFSSYDFLFLREVFDIPFVTTFHGLLPNNIRMLDHGALRGILETGDAFLVNTCFARDQLLELQCPERKIHIIPQGTDIGEFKFMERHISPGQPVRILSVGRLSPEKGFHVAVRAIARLQAQVPGIEYRIIGDGVERQALQDLIDSLGVAGSVTLCGYVATEELQRHYNEAHLFILPSIDLRDGTHTETQGVVLQEAQASGIPVIASRTGGIPEVIRDGVTGILFDEEDDATLSTCIRRLIDDDVFYSAVARQGRTDVEENYSLEVISARQLAVYKELLAGRAGGKGL